MTTAQHLNLWLIQSLASSGELDTLPDAPDIPVVHEMGRYCQRANPYAAMNEIAGALPLDTQLVLQRKGWTRLTIDLHACIRSRSPEAVIHLRTYDDLLFRIITLPISNTDAAWVRNTFRLDANALKNDRSLFSCLAHQIRRTDKLSSRAVEKLYALGYRFCEQDRRVLMQKGGAQSRHAVSWLEREVEQVPERLAGIIPPEPRKSPPMGTRILEV